jgi:arginyl-tRNA synthetase
VTTAPASDPLAGLRAAVVGATSVFEGEAGERLGLERPPKPELGDYSTNAAMLLAPAAASPPREVAERLRGELEGILGASAERIEVAGPGFINIFLSDRWHREAVSALLEAGERLGAGHPESPERILVEFVSANPTGPTTAASGRGAAYGDALARLLEHSGDSVEREYYINDAGSQVELFARSIAARMSGSEAPEDGYTGEYVAELAAELASAGASADDLEALATLATEAMRVRIERTLERFGVRYQTWSSERRLRESGVVAHTVEELRSRGHVYDHDGAIWLRTTEFGDDKDRVLIRADGEPTYFAPDIAYHLDKLERGHERLINVLGADHHGYVARLKGAVAAVGADPDRLEVPILQFVHIVEGGARASMSKRRGDFVSLDDLIDEIGVDATRWFMLSRSHDSSVDLDLTLAKAESSENPVYYVQYAHARIASMLRRAGEERVAAALGDSRAGLVLEPAERELVRRLLAFPAEVAEAAERSAPHRIAAYALDVAQVFTAFYRDCRVVGAEPAPLESFRIALSVAAQRVIARSLGLLGVSAPESM